MSDSEILAAIDAGDDVTDARLDDKDRRAEAVNAALAAGRFLVAKCLLRGLRRQT